MQLIYKCSVATFDISEFPLVKIVCHKEQPNLEDVIEYKNLKNKVFKDFNEPFIVISDVSKIKWMDSEARIEYGKNLKESDDKYLHLFKTAYVVVPNIVVNIMLKGINLVAKPRFRQVICSSYDEAYKKAKSELKFMIDYQKVS